MLDRRLITIALGAALSGVAIANNCNHGLYYCGSSLLQKGEGNYYQDISNDLTDAGQPHDDSHIEQSLFFCKGDDDVTFIKYCDAGCQDNGKGRSDNCK